jgi:hypothetical protein
MESLLTLVKRKRVAGAIGCPRYLLGASGEDARLLRRVPSGPLPLRDVIFLYEYGDISAWLLANDGKHPLDLMVLEPRLGDGEDEDQTPPPAHSRYPFFDQMVWDHCGEAGDIGEAIGEEVVEVEEDLFEADEIEEDETEEDSGDGAIVIEDVSF